MYIFFLEILMCVFLMRFTTQEIAFSFLLWQFEMVENGSGN